MNGDTYRPLRSDDPVGTEVWSILDSKDMQIIARHGGWCWVFAKDSASGYLRHSDKLLVSVRVPDPWGELLEAAKFSSHNPYPSSNWQNRLFAAIAAVEASQAKAVTNGYTEVGRA